jgi:hypothetical protein
MRRGEEGDMLGCGMECERGGGALKGVVGVGGGVRGYFMFGFGFA